MVELNNGNAREIVFSEIRRVDFEKVLEPFISETVEIDNTGVTYHGYTFSKRSMLPGDEDFERFYEVGVCELGDNITELALWLLNTNSICSL